MPRMAWVSIEGIPDNEVGDVSNGPEAYRVDGEQRTLAEIKVCYKWLQSGGGSVIGRCSTHQQLERVASRAPAG